MFQHLGGCFSTCFGFDSGRKYMFLDILLVWKQSKTSKSVSSPTNSVSFDTFSEAAIAVCTINRSASAVPCSVCQPCRSR